MSLPWAMSSHGLINTVCTVSSSVPAVFSSSSDSGIQPAEKRSRAAPAENFAQQRHSPRVDSLTYVGSAVSEDNNIGTELKRRLIMAKKLLLQIARNTICFV